MGGADMHPPTTIPHVYLEYKHLSVTWERKGKSRAIAKRDLGPSSPAPQERGFQQGKGLHHHAALQGTKVSFRTGRAQLIANIIRPGRWQQKPATENVEPAWCVGAPPRAFVRGACHLAKSAQWFTGDHIPYKGGLLLTFCGSGTSGYPLSCVF